MDTRLTHNYYPSIAWMEKYAQQTPPTRKLSAIGSYPIPLRGTDQIVEVSKLDPEIVFSP